MKIMKRSNNYFSGFSRLDFLNLFILVISAVIIGRLFFLMIIKHDDYAKIAESQQLVKKANMPTRGNIYIHDQKFTEDVLAPVAINKKYYLVYAVPNKISNVSSTAKLLAPILEEDENILYQRLAKENDIYEPLKRRLEESVKMEIEALNLPGIAFEKETFRYYPEGENLGQVLGFVGYQGDNLKGQYGIEGYWEQELAGDTSERFFERDAKGVLRSVSTANGGDKNSGSDLVLTIDRTVQFTVCAALKNSVAKTGADGGSVIIIEPKTGAIIAMCNYPDFDSNNYQTVADYQVYKNAVIDYPYEPGSVIKVITMSGAIDAGTINSNTVYNDTGAVKIDSYTIQNSDKKAHGAQTMTNVLEKSLNTGAIFAMRSIGAQVFIGYLERFGFGSLFDLPLNTERAGDIPADLKKGKEINLATASFGQGFTATPLQLAAAFSAIANKGRLMKPYIVEEVIRPDGTKEEFAPQFLRQVISEKTASIISAMMVSVLKLGHGSLGNVPGYYIGGKTGTAEVPIDGKYSPDSTIHTFAGFGPISNPRFVMITKLVHPRSAVYAESTAAPLFGEIAKFLLNYMRVPPDYVK